MKELEKKLNYTFKNSSLLKNALTHSSYANENRAEGISSNERLEFLGDSVLGFVTAKRYEFHRAKMVTSVQHPTKTASIRRIRLKLLSILVSDLNSICFHDFNVPVLFIFHADALRYFPVRNLRHRLQILRPWSRYG